jgi:hypothetical protein
MQVNIGIIAACAPTLRPLFSGLLHLASESGRSRYPASGNKYGPSRNSVGVYGTSTIGGGRLGGGGGGSSGHRASKAGWVKAGSRNDEFELMDESKESGVLDEYERDRRRWGQNSTNVGAGGWGREDMILGRDSPDDLTKNGGILRTTVVTVI